MNFVGTTTCQGTKKDADELYSMFKDDVAKCTSSFEWAHIREGKMIFIKCTMKTYKIKNGTKFNG